MSKIIISSSDVEAVTLPKDAIEVPRLPAAIPLWARLTMLPLVLFLPLLAIAALVIRIGMRAAPPRTQQAWHSYLVALMIASSFVFTIGAVLLFSYFPAPPQAISAGLSDLDERTDFPMLPVASRMSGVEVAQHLKPLVMVASPAAKRWIFRGTVPSGYVGAAVLLQANSKGYLFATARHVAVGPNGRNQAEGRVLLTTGTGSWAGADIIAVHDTADLALLWIPRHEGSAQFVQPLAPTGEVQSGANIYVIGHPEGLDFTLSNGMISRLSGDTVQISAPVSPGDSGGPVYTDRGSLVAVVVAKLDRAVDPNAENLNFAAAASLLARTSGWSFAPGGQQHLRDFISATSAIENRSN